MLALLTFKLCTAQYDPEAKAILDAMSANYKGIKAFTASFTQKLTNESANLNEALDGVITVMDNMYKLEIADQEIYNDGTDVWTFNKELNEVTVSPYMSDDQEISLNNIWDIYQEGFKFILLSSNPNGNQVVDLEPIDRSGTYFKIRMIISASSELFSFTIFENTGNKFQYLILNFSERTDLTKDFFTFNPDNYEGIDVIDFR